jgi:hypothetical protein
MYSWRIGRVDALDDEFAAVLPIEDRTEGKLESGRGQQGTRRIPP